MCYLRLHHAKARANVDEAMRFSAGDKGRERWIETGQAVRKRGGKRGTRLRWVARLWIAATSQCSGGHLDRLPKRLGWRRRCAAEDARVRTGSTLRCCCRGALCGSWHTSPANKKCSSGVAASLPDSPPRLGRGLGLGSWERVCSTRLRKPPESLIGVAGRFWLSRQPLSKSKYTHLSASPASLSRARP